MTVREDQLHYQVYVSVKNACFKTATLKQTRYRECHLVKGIIFQKSTKPRNNTDLWGVHTGTFNKSLILCFFLTPRLFVFIGLLG